VKLATAEHYQLQAKVCFGMAETAPNDEIKFHWLALADGYARAAKLLELQQPPPEGDPSLRPPSS
jgi:hypothetical protein